MPLSDLRAAVDLLARRGVLRHATLRGGARLARSLLARRQDLWLGIEVHAAETPDAPAVRDESRALTYGALDAEAAAVAGWLAERGLRRGDRVAVLLSNRVEFFAVSSACARIGLVAMPGSPATPPDALVRRLQETDAAAAFVEAPLAAAARDGLRRPPEHVVVVGGESDVGTPYAAARGRPPRPAAGTADDTNLVLFTSGTTGRSRGTRIAAGRAGPLTALRYLSAFDLSRDSVVFTPCPLYHAAPLVVTGLALLIGASVVVSRRLDDPVGALLSARATHAFLVPTLLERLARLPDAELLRLRRGPLRAVLSSGAALRPALKRTLLERLGPVLYDFYGATELGIVSIATPMELAWDPTTVGRILPGIEARLVDDDGRPVPPGEAGLLQVRASTVSDGYLGEPVHGPERWHTAGDVCRIEDGLLYVVDRKRDVVISGGVNIFPVDVEEAVEAHPSVREASAVGVPDPEWGEALHVFVVLEDGASLDPDALGAHCRETLPRYAVPKAFHPLDELPRSPTGKVLRRALRERVEVSAPAPADDPSGDPGSP